jgi:Kef-type K+ transport system membrane component KefB
MPPTGPPPEVLAPADVIPYVLGGIALILIVARIVGTLFERIGQPRIVGEIIAGILIGPTVLQGALDRPALPGPTDSPMDNVAAVAGEGLVNDIFPLQSFAFINLIGTIALVFYMFLVGLELDEKLLKGRARQMTTVALGVTLVPLVLGFVAAAVLSGDTFKPEGVSTTTFALFMGAAISVTAFPVMARILQEKGLIAAPMGAVGVGSAAIVTVVMFLLIAAASASAKESGIVDSVGVKILLLLALIAVLFIVVRPLLARVLAGYREGDPVDGNVIGALLAGALLTGLATDRILGAALVGGFLFGAAVPGITGFAQAVIARMETAVIIFFLPIFLAVSGLRTDLTLINGTVILGALFFLVLMVAGKWGAGFLAGRAAGLKSDEANVIGILMNCRGLLILVVALIGLQLQVITPQTQLLFVIGAIVTTMMTGPLVDRAMPEEKVRESTATLDVSELQEGERRSKGTAVIAG